MPLQPARRLQWHLGTCKCATCLCNMSDDECGEEKGAMLRTQDCRGQHNASVALLLLVLLLLLLLLLCLHCIASRMFASLVMQFGMMCAPQCTCELCWHSNSILSTLLGHWCMAPLHFQVGTWSCSVVGCRTNLLLLLLPPYKSYAAAAAAAAVQTCCNNQQQSAHLLHVACWLVGSGMMLSRMESTHDDIVSKPSCDT